MRQESGAIGRGPTRLSPHCPVGHVRAYTDVILGPACLPAVAQQVSSASGMSLFSAWKQHPRLCDNLSPHSWQAARKASHSCKPAQTRGHRDETRSLCATHACACTMPHSSTESSWTHGLGGCVFGWPITGRPIRQPGSMHHVVLLCLFLQTNRVLA